MTVDELNTRYLQSSRLEAPKNTVIFPDTNPLIDVVTQFFSKNIVNADVNPLIDQVTEFFGFEKKVSKSHFSLPESVDWVAAGKVSIPYIDQGACGSCWAYTTASTLESAFAIKNNLEVLPIFSIQYLLDCDTMNFGCEGGWMLDSYEWIRDNGILMWDDYPTGYMGT